MWRPGGSPRQSCAGRAGRTGNRQFGRSRRGSRISCCLPGAPIPPPSTRLSGIRPATFRLPMPAVRRGVAVLLTGIAGIRSVNSRILARPSDACVKGGLCGSVCRRPCERILEAGLLICRPSCGPNAGWFFSFAGFDPIAAGGGRVGVAPLLPHPWPRSGSHGRSTCRSGRRRLAA